MGGGVGSVAKRKRREGMDTEAVQTTLQAMRIQVGGDKMLGRWRLALYWFILFCMIAVSVGACKKKARL